MFWPNAMLAAVTAGAVQAASVKNWKPSTGELDSATCVGADTFTALPCAS